MNNSFVDNLHSALAYRKQTYFPNVNLVFYYAIALVLVFIFISILIVPKNKYFGYNFISEHGSITALSAILLAAASSFSIAALIVNIKNRTSDTFMWIVMSAGFAFLAFDELLQFHERLGFILGHITGSGIFRNWNDIIVILYGVIALPVIVALLPVMLRYRMFLELLLLAFIFYVIHTVIDSTQTPRTPISAIFEESAKIYSVLFFALAMLMGFVGSLWHSSPSRKA